MSISFSVVIPTYNRATHISVAIKSFLNQQHSNFELIIVDDGSTDNTTAVVKTFTDRRIQYHLIENSERGVARNFGASKATGDYITFFDSDDVVYPWYLSHAAAELLVLSKPECYAQHFEFRTEIPKTLREERGHTITSFLANPKLLHSNFLACNGVFIRKDISNKFRFSDDRGLSGSEDWVLWLQLSANFNFYYSPVTCSCLILHDERGESNIVLPKLLIRLKLLINMLETDTQISKLPPALHTKVISSAYLFAGLKLADFIAYKRASMEYLWKSFRLYPGIIFKRNLYVANKKLFFKWI